MDKCSSLVHTEKRRRTTTETVKEIIAYLETELAAAHEAHDQAQDKQERLYHLIKASTIAQVLEEIKR